MTSDAVQPEAEREDDGVAQQEIGGVKRQLGLRDRVQAVVLADETGLVMPGP